jgi:hypothetical protein
MSTLDTTMRMQYANQQEVPQAINQLGETLGGIMAQRGQRSFQQDAIKWFSDGEVTPDKIKQFSSMYPGVDPQEVFKIAGAAAQQNRAQKVKDLGATIMRIASENNGELPQEKFAELTKGVDGSLVNEVMTAFTSFKKVHPEVKWLDTSEGKSYQQTIGGKPTGIKIEGEPKTPKEKSSLENAVAQKMLETNPDTGTNFTASEAYQAVTHPPQPAKEVNVANEIDTILGGMFPGYYTDEKTRKDALKYYATPEGSQKVQSLAAKYAKSKAPESFTFTPTSEGIVPGNTRTGQMGSPATNSGGEAYTKPLSEAASKEFGALAQLQGTLGKIRELYKPAYVGPVMGRYYSVAENLVNLPAEQVKFNSYVNDAKDALLRARSGAQINEQEYARLVKFLPTTELPDKNFEARVARFEEQLQILQEEKAKVYSGQGYKIDVSTGQKEKSIIKPRKIGRFTVEVE